MTGLDSQKGSAPPLECDLDLGHSGKFLRTGKVEIITQCTDRYQRSGICHHYLHRIADTVLH